MLTQFYLLSCIAQPKTKPLEYFHSYAEMPFFRN